MMKKKVIMVHGWGGSPDSEAWFPWLKNELTKKGVLFKFPRMPNTDNPKIDAWVKKLKEESGEIDENTYFIGHSMGCQTIMRYLEKLDKNKKIGGIIFVAGWINLIMENIESEGKESVKIAKSWINSPINFKKVKNHTNKILVILSDNDSWVPISDGELFKKNLGARLIIKHNEEHFNDTKEIKEILEFLK